MSSSYIPQSVTISFLNSLGKPTTSILSAKYSQIERINLKPSITKPTIRPLQPKQCELGVFKHLINQRRNTSTLRSFISINDINRQEIDQIQNICRDGIGNIKEEMETIGVLRSQITMNRFVVQTGASENDAREYLKEFKGNVQEAVNVYKFRMKLVDDVAKNKNMPRDVVLNFLKQNDYNSALLE